MASSDTVATVLHTGRNDSAPELGIDHQVDRVVPNADQGHFKPSDIRKIRSTPEAIFADLAPVDPDLPQEQEVAPRTRGWAYPAVVLTDFIEALISPPSRKADGATPPVSPRRTSGCARPTISAACARTSGERVLVFGALGSVGTFAVQLANDVGARITGVCGAANVDLVRSLGADDFIDYPKDDFVAVRKKGGRFSPSAARRRFSSEISRTSGFSSRPAG